MLAIYICDYYQETINLPSYCSFVNFLKLYQPIARHWGSLEIG